MYVCLDVLSQFTILDMLFIDVFVFKQKTAYEMRISDWISDVCSSDLAGRQEAQADAADRARLAVGKRVQLAAGLGAEALAHDRQGLRRRQQIGRESGRERVCQYV